VLTTKTVQSETQVLIDER